MNSTKEKIILAAINCLGKSAAASLEEIATSIQLSRRTIHRHFPSKTALIDQITSYASAHCLNTTKAALKNSKIPKEQLHQMFRSDVQSGMQFRFLYQIGGNMETVEEQSDDFKTMMLLFREVLNTLKLKGDLLPEVTLPWIEQFYLATIDAAIAMQMRPETTTTGQEITTMAWSSFARAVFLNPDT
ncbi:hypothetical protein TPENAI_70571 [Tenacibaculum litopenaei]|uniref:TetR/AcrR family transcriptional regulator n=1 Tax=Tenacibaculum litopenaei TaxID=396016 RepID=UPI0038961AF7